MITDGDDIDQEKKKKKKGGGRAPPPHKQENDLANVTRTKHLYTATITHTTGGAKRDTSSPEMFVAGSRSDATLSIGGDKTPLTRVITSPSASLLRGECALGSRRGGEI